MINIEKMYIQHDFSYKGISAKSFGVFISDKPDIPAAEENVEFKSVKGRDGALTVKDGTYKDVEFDLDMQYICEEDQHDRRFRVIKKWLSGSGDFVPDVDDMFYRKVKSITVGKNARVGKKTGVISTHFRIDPYEYFRAITPISNPTAITNQFDADAEPNYTITGLGLCTLTVNGKIFKVQSGGSATIDVSRMITFNTSTGVVNNAMAAGKYEDLILHQGNNTISITSGFDLTVVPNWRTL